MKLHLPHLETNVTSLCQNDCVACNHFVPLLRGRAPEYADPHQVERDLAALEPILHVDAYGMLGGEPTLHKGLVDILRVAKASRIADRVEVWTNGQTLRQMAPAFWRAFDVLVVSAYPGKLTDADLAWIAAKSADEHVELQVKDERHYPNFTQLLDMAHPEGATARYQACWFKTYSRVVDRGVFYRCCTSPYIPRLLLDQPEGTDGIAVEGLTAEALDAFLGQRETPASCAVCAGRNTSSAYPIPWAEIRDPQRWLAASGGTA